MVLCMTLQGDGAWEPKEKMGRKPQRQTSGLKPASQPTSRHSHSAADAQQSSDPSSNDEPADNDDQAIEVTACLFSTDHAVVLVQQVLAVLGAALVKLLGFVLIHVDLCEQEESVQAAKVTRARGALLPHASIAQKEADSAKAARGRRMKSEKAAQPAELTLETDAVKLEPSSVPADAATCSGAVKPHTPAKVRIWLHWGVAGLACLCCFSVLRCNKQCAFAQGLAPKDAVVENGWLRQGMESKPAPGDAGTDSGEDEDAKLASGAAEQPQPARAAADTLAGKRSGAAGTPSLILLFVVFRLFLEPARYRGFYV